MECWRLTKRKARSLIFMMLLMFMVRWINGVCIEEERKALLEIKASFKKSFHSYDVDNLLPTWVDRGSTTGSECCDWERVKCHATTGHVTDLFLSDMQTLNPRYIVVLSDERTWSLNVSHFLHFKELKSLDLSYNFLDNTIVSTGLERLSSLKKLEILNLASSRIDNHIFPSLGGLASLKILNLGLINGMDGFSPAQDISEFPALENLEALDLTHCGCYGSFQMQGFEGPSILNKLKILSLGNNQFNESLLASLSSLQSLTTLNLEGNNLSGLFPAEGLAHLTKLKKLDLMANYELKGSPSIQGCKSLLRLKRLKSINLAYNNFNKSVISCLSFLPSLKILDLRASLQSGGSFPMQELLNFPDLEVLLLSDSNFNGTLPIEALTSFHHLKVLDFSSNNFVGGIPSTIKSLSSLRAISFASNMLNGSLPNDGKL